MPISKQSNDTIVNTTQSGIFSGGFGIFCVLAGLFVMSQFLRVANAVMAKDLMCDLHLSASELGTLGSAFFYAFALMQLPLGWALDRMPTWLIMTFIPLFSALGVVIFAMAQGFTMAWIGWMFCGIGMSAVLMGSMKIFAQRYNPSYFGTLSSLMISIGGVGNIFAATPLVILMTTFGWRKAFLGIGGIIGFLCGLAFWLLYQTRHDTTRRISSGNSSNIPFGKGVRIVLSSLTFWQCAAVSFVFYGTFVAIQGLWGGPYLRDVAGFSPLATGNILFCLALGRILGSPLGGILSDRIFRTRKWIVIPALAIYSIAFLGLNGVVSFTSAWAYGVVFFGIAAFSSTSVLLYAQLKEIMPPQVLGFTSTSLNFFVMVGGAVLIQLIGYIVQYYPHSNGIYSIEAYYTAFWVCLGLSLASLLFYLFSKERRPEV